jgi:hypothetical protein
MPTRITSLNDSLGQRQLVQKTGFIAPSREYPKAAYAVRKNNSVVQVGLIIVRPQAMIWIILIHTALGVLPLTGNACIQGKRRRQEPPEWLRLN